jgi:hypothetical protein
VAVNRVHGHGWRCFWGKGGRVRLLCRAEPVMVPLLTAGVCALCRAGERLGAFMWFGAEEWGLDVFMGWGHEERGEAWTFKCPPGHRIVGYAGTASAAFGVHCVCFLTAEFQDPAAC